MKKEPLLPVKKEPIVPKEKLLKIVKEETTDMIEVMKQDNDISEPETGQEPAGPDQNLPVATVAANSESMPPPERKATSYINVSVNLLY